MTTAVPREEPMHQEVERHALDRIEAERKAGWWAVVDRVLLCLAVTSFGALLVLSITGQEFAATIAVILTTALLVAGVAASIREWYLRNKEAS